MIWSNKIFIVNILTTATEGTYMDRMLEMSHVGREMQSPLYRLVRASPPKPTRPILPPTSHLMSTSPSPVSNEGDGRTQHHHHYHFIFSNMSMYQFNFRDSTAQYLQHISTVSSAH